MNAEVAAAINADTARIAAYVSERAPELLSRYEADPVAVGRALQFATLDGPLVAALVARDAPEVGRLLLAAAHTELAGMAAGDAEAEALDGAV